jgi:hypothetical protein
MITESVVSVALKTSIPAVVDLTVKVTWPAPSLGPEAALMVGVPGPEDFARVTVLPETATLVLSFKVTVIVEIVAPSAAIGVGDAPTVDCAAVAPKVTVAVCVMTTVAVVSVAVKTSAPAVVDFTVKVTTPEVLLAAGALMLGEPGPEVLARLTVSPETGALVLSSKVTVIVEPVAPSAGTAVGDAITVEFVGEGLAASTVEASPAVRARLSRTAAPMRAVRDEVNAIISSCFSGLAAEFSNDAARTPNRLSVAASAACIGPTWPRRPKVVAWARSV